MLLQSHHLIHFDFPFHQPSFCLFKPRPGNGTCGTGGIAWSFHPYPPLYRESYFRLLSDYLLLLGLLSNLMVSVGSSGLDI